jgi:hypothetical protein
MQSVAQSSQRFLKTIPKLSITSVINMLSSLLVSNLMSAAKPDVNLSRKLVLNNEVFWIFLFKFWLDIDMIYFEFVVQNGFYFL